MLYYLELLVTELLTNAITYYLQFIFINDHRPCWYDLFSATLFNHVLFIYFSLLLPHYHPYNITRTIRFRHGQVATNFFIYQHGNMIGIVLSWNRSWTHLRVS